MEKKERMKVRLASFGFKYGVPQDLHFLWDVRFLPNPYWIAALRPKNGLEKEVSDYVVSSSECHSFLKMIKPLLLFIIQQNIIAEKKELHIAIGCTGGRHRSVAVVEVLRDLLQMLPVELQTEHRDIGRES